MKGVKFTAKEKKRALEMWLVEKKHWLYVCKKMRCTRVSLWRWKTQYDGTLDSLTNRSSRPLTPHPNSQTEQEKNDIMRLYAEDPTRSYTELYGELRARCAYSRHYMTMYKFIRRQNFQPAEIIRRVSQPYDTPEMLGQKWQMDVKFVPRECYVGAEPYRRSFQYTMIDEATRERFIRAYSEHNGNATKDFIMRAIVYFGYLPVTIQTDNGAEFTYPRGEAEKIHIVDETLQQFGIRHQLIKPRTPRHNGKVERSHRTDQERFYNFLQFSTFDELQEKMSQWLVRYNSTPSTALRDKDGRRAMQSPLDKRAELLELLQKRTDVQVRFLEKSKRSAA